MIVIRNIKSKLSCGQGGTRTLMSGKGPRILSPLRLPIPPLAPNNKQGTTNKKQGVNKHENEDYIIRRGILCSLLSAPYSLRWRPEGELNSCRRFCRPLPNHSGIRPSLCSKRIKSPGERQRSITRNPWITRGKAKTPQINRAFSKILFLITAQSPPSDSVDRKRKPLPSFPYKCRSDFL